MVLTTPEGHIGVDLFLPLLVFDRVMAIEKLTDIDIEVRFFLSLIG
jgi:hypothetical protein